MGKILFILLEGNDDERFFDGIITPLLAENYQKVKLWQHAQKSNEAIERLLVSIKKIDADYIYVEDLDHFKKPQAKKDKIMERLDYLSREKIMIVIREIESWYLAGVNQQTAQKLGISSLESTEKISKEDFNQLISIQHRDSRIDLMREIIKHYSIPTARQKNKSFNYFYEQYILKS